MLDNKNRNKENRNWIRGKEERGERKKLKGRERKERKERMVKRTGKFGLRSKEEMPRGEREWRS